MRYLLTAIAAILFTTAAFSQTDEEAFMKLINEKIAADPANPELYTMRARGWAEAKKWKKAIPDLEKALSLIPAHLKKGAPAQFMNHQPFDSSEIIYMRAFCYSQLKMLDSAIADFRVLQNRHPNHFYYITAVAHLYMDNKQFDMAQREIDRVRRNKKHEERALSTQAILFFEEEKYEQALQAVDDALVKYPGSIHSLLTKTKILIKLDKKAEACKTAEEGLQKMNKAYFGEGDYEMDFTFQLQDLKKENCK